MEKCFNQRKRLKVDSTTVDSTTVDVSHQTYNVIGELRVTNYRSKKKKIDPINNKNIK